MSVFQQSAIKSTGGKAPRKSLQKARREKRSRPGSDDEYVEKYSRSPSVAAQAPAPSTTTMTTRQNVLKQDVSRHIICMW